MTLNISDTSILPTLLEAIKELKGVTIAHMPHVVSTVTEKVDGEKWARETLLPLVQEVKDKSAKGYSYPDAHEFLKEIETEMS